MTCHALVRCHLTVLHLLGFCSRAFGEVSMTTRLALGEFCQRDKHSATESPRPSKSKTTRVLPLRSALNIASARPGGLHGTGAARAARVSERPGCAIARNLRIARDMSDPHPSNTPGRMMIIAPRNRRKHRTSAAPRVFHPAEAWRTQPSTPSSPLRPAARPSAPKEQA